MLREAIRFLGPCDLITVTLPGQDRLRWDRSKCSHGPNVKCSGTRGCRVLASDLAACHRTFCDDWDALWRAARSALYRRGILMPPNVVALELQDRGALHLHVAIPVTQRRAGYLLWEYLVAYGPRYGFGAADWEPARTAGESAPGLGSYISKLARYVTKESRGEANGLREVLEAVPGRRVFRVSHKVTRETRATMRNLRAVRFFFVAGGRHPALVPSPAVAERAMVVWRGMTDEYERGEGDPPDAFDVLLALGHVPIAA